MFGLVVVLLLASHGNEGTREDKFRGSLVAPPVPPVATLDRAATLRELDALRLARPDFVPAAVTMSISGTVALAGLVVLTIAAAIGGAGSVTALLIVGVLCLPGGSIVALAAGGVLLSVVADREAIDARIRTLREKLGMPADPPPLVLARF